MRKYLFLGLFLCSTPLRGWAQQDTIADQHLQEVVITAKLPLVEMTPEKQLSVWMNLLLKAMETYMMYSHPYRG